MNLISMTALDSHWHPRRKDTAGHCLSQMNCRAVGPPGNQAIPRFGLLSQRGDATVGAAPLYNAVTATAAPPCREAQVLVCHRTPHLLTTTMCSQCLPATRLLSQGPLPPAVALWTVAKEAQLPAYVGTLVALATSVQGGAFLCLRSTSQNQEIFCLQPTAHQPLLQS